MIVRYEMVSDSCKSQVNDLPLGQVSKSAFYYVRPCVLYDHQLRTGLGREIEAQVQGLAARRETSRLDRNFGSVDKRSSDDLCRAGMRRNGNRKNGSEWEHG